MKVKVRKQNSGITLIALVITIIVLLILVGISIASLTGENGILTKAQSAKVENTKSQAEEDVKLAVGTLQIEESTKEITQEEKRQLLENELKQQQEDSTVAIKGEGFLANHRGYEFDIDNKYKVKEAFNAEEWDKTASSDELFEWDETGTIIVGYKDTLAGHEKIRIPSKCTAIIPNYAWQSNVSTRSIISGGVKKIELPETITEIGKKTFAQFKDLESINIPDNVTSISDGLFSGCTNLTSIIIPDNVISIGNGAFESCTSLTSITIPDNVTSIGSYAFDGCTSLTSITIPDNVTSIGSYAFDGCTSLTSITIPENITSINNGTFSRCTSLTSITIPKNVTNIGAMAFGTCTSLTSITIPENVISIGGWAFSSCTSLTSITIPNSVRNMEYFVFAKWESNQAINCRASSQPSGWDSRWDDYYYDEEPKANIVWNYTGK